MGLDYFTLFQSHLSKLNFWLTFHPPITHPSSAPSGSHLPARQDVAGQLDLGEVSLADGLEQTVVADVRQLVRAGGDGVPAAGAQRAAGQAGALV